MRTGPVATYACKGGDKLMRLTNNMGMRLLGVYLIASGLVPLGNISLAGLGAILHILALAAGVTILLSR